MKEILLYGALFMSTIVKAMEDFNNVGNEDVTVRINTEGGSVEGTWGAITKFSELKGKKTVKVDGGAHSMGAFFLAYADYVEAADFARFTLHRAAYPEYIEQSETGFTEERRANITAINKSLRAALESKVTAKKFAQVTGVTLNELFSLDNRIEVQLTAKEAKEIGLVDKVVKITAAKRAELTAYAHGIAANFVPDEDENLNTNKNDKMTIAELKEKSPEAYAAAIAIGVKKELERAKAWAEFSEVDAAGVKAGIASGEPITQAEIIAFTRKEYAAAQTAAAEAEAAPATPTAEATTTPAATVVAQAAAAGKTEAEATAEAKALADFMAEAKGALGLKSETVKTV